MTPITDRVLAEALNWRYATKQFDRNKTIPADTWSALEQSLVQAPSSFGLQPWRFLVVQDPTLRARLAEVSWKQTQPVDCSHYVVFLGKKDLGEAHVDHYFQRHLEVRGGSLDAVKGYRDIILGSLAQAKQQGRLDVWQSRQVYIALGQFMTAAALLGVDTCPMEGLDPAKYDEILGVDTKEWGTLVACAAGYRAETDKYAAAPKIRFKTEELVKYI